MSAFVTKLIMVCEQVLSNGSLAVSEVYMEDSGAYGCTAENAGGSRRAQLYLHVTSASSLSLSRFLQTRLASRQKRPSHYSNTVGITHTHTHY